MSKGMSPEPKNEWRKTMNTKAITKGCIKFNSIKALAEAHGMNYITLYMRLRSGMSPSQAVAKKVRGYVKRDNNISVNTVNSAA